VLRDDVVEAFVERRVAVETDGVRHAGRMPHQDHVTRVEVRTVRELEECPGVAAWWYPAADACVSDERHHWGRAVLGGGLG
jgi:hypothetical protein